MTKSEMEETFDFIIKFKALDDELKAKAKEHERLKKQVVDALHSHGTICYHGLKAQLISRSRVILDQRKIKEILEDDISFVEKQCNFEELVIEEEKLLF